MIRKTIKFCAIGAAILVAVVLVVAVFFSFSPGEKILKNIAESQLEAYLGSDVQIAQLKTNVVSRLQLMHIRVIDSLAGSQMIPASIDSVSVHYSLLGLIRGNLNINEARIEGVSLLLRRDTTGGLHVAESVALDTLQSDTGGGGSALTIQLGNLTMSNVRVTYIDEPVDLTLQLADGSLEVASLADSGYRYTVSIDSIAATYDTLKFSTYEVSAHGRLADNAVHLDTLRFVGPGVTVAASGQVPMSVDSGKIAAEVQVTGKRSPSWARLAAHYGLPVVQLQDELLAEITLRGKVSRPEASAQAQLPEIRFDTISVGPGLLRASYQNDSLQLDTAYLSGFGGGLSANARVSLDSLNPGGQAKLVLANLSIGDLWSLVHAEASPYQGRLAANIDASWSSYDPESLHVASELHGTQLQYAGRKLPDLDATLAMKDGIGRLNIRHPVIQADISGRLHADSVNARYVLSISDLRPVAGLADVEQLSGRFRAKGQVNGTFVNPELTAAVSGASIKYSGWPIDTLVAQLRYRDSVLRVIDLSARGELDSIDAGMLPVDSVPVGGRLRYSLTGSGTVDSMNAVFTADVRQPHYGEYSLDSGSVAATLNGTTVHVDFLNAWHNNLYAVIQGRFDTRRLKGEINGRLTDLAAGDTLTVDSATDSLNAVKGKGPAGNFHAAFDLSDSTDMQAEINGSEIDLAILSQLVSDSLRAGGTVSLNGRFDGTPARPNASLKATATAVQYDRYVIDSVAVSADLSPGELKLSRFTAYVLADTLSVAGSVPLKTGKTGSLEIDRARPLNGTIRARQVDLTALQKILPDSVAVSGRLDVNLDVGGTADLPSVSGNVTLADGEFNPGPERPPLEKININADLLDSTIIIKSASAEMKSRPLSLTGKLTVSHRKKVIASLDLEMPESASVRIDGWASTDSIDANVNIDRIRLSLLASYVPNVHDLRGLLVCNLTMTGNLGLPAVHGQLRADSIGFALQMYPVTVSGGAARISFTRERIRIDTLNAGLNGGSVSIDGWVEHSGEQIDDVQLTLNARNIDYHQPGFVNLKLDSAALAYDHQEDFFLFQGDVYLGDSKFTRNLRVPEILPWARSVERIETTYPSPLDKTRLDIRMRQNGELWIDDNIAKLRLNAAIGMRGSPARPTFSGRVGVDEGYLLYLDRQFEVTEGTVYFADPRRFNPDITLRAEAHVTTYEGLQSTTYDIKFSAAGPLDQLETKLTSEPPLDKPDIVSVLTIGATRGQLLGEHGAGGQGTGSVLLERAGAISTREISGYVSRELGGALGLDELSVQGNLFSSTSEPTRITAAKQVTTRAKLSYSTAVGHANDQRVRLDYKLTPRFMLEGMTDQSGKALISLKYSLKFK